LAGGVNDGDLLWHSQASTESRYYTTVVQGLSVQARDGATCADPKTVITHGDGRLRHARIRAVTHRRLSAKTGLQQNRNHIADTVRADPHEI
jgi:hypothetical protein